MCIVFAWLIAKHDVDICYPFTYLQYYFLVIASYRSYTNTFSLCFCLLLLVSYPSYINAFSIRKGMTVLYPIMYYAALCCDTLCYWVYCFFQLLVLGLSLVAVARSFLYCIVNTNPLLLCWFCVIVFTPANVSRLQAYVTLKLCHNYVC